MVAEFGLETSCIDIDSVAVVDGAREWLGLLVSLGVVVVVVVVEVVMVVGRRDGGSGESVV